jgi:hypothetical protein
MIHLYLYSTSHCHLCELAETLLNNLAFKYEFNWKIIEIVEDENLLSRYAILIPVIAEPNSGIEISWPFSAEDIVGKFNLKQR